jgi:hypothetical protein
MIRQEGRSTINSCTFYDAIDEKPILCKVIDISVTIKMIQLAISELC